MLGAVTASAQQERLVTGTVIEQASGKPLPGVTVVVKETSVGTATDVNGQFSIPAQPGQVLRLSFLGYGQQEVTVNTSTAPLSLSLNENPTELSEVVVTGALGIKRSARELGGGNQQIESERLNQGRVVNPVLGLSGKVAGLRINLVDSKVDPQVQVLLRGARSISGNNAPLYVVDGVPVPNINRLNPNDIESINVLKGANAAALYGSEGVNGALIVTTKAGQRGQARVSYTNTSTFGQVYLIPPTQNEFGMGVDGVYNPTQFESWGPRFDGEVRPVGPALADGTRWQLPYSPVDNLKEDLFQTTTTQQNDLSFSGGDEKSTYFFSLQDVNTKGIIPDDKTRRTGGRFNGSRTFGKLTTSYNLNYVFSKTETTPDGPWITAYQMPANVPFHQLKDLSNPFANPSAFFTDMQQNPYFQIANNRQTSEQQTLNGKIEFNYRVLPWLSAIYRAGLFNTNTDTRSTVGKFLGTGRRNIAGSVNDGSETFRRLNSDLILNAEKKFGDFNFRLLAGQNLRADNTKTTGIAASALVVPGLFNPENRVGELTGSSSITEYRQLAGYGELTAGYRNYLFLTLTGRQEWVSVLSEENRSYFYPGVSSSFVFNEAIPALRNSNVLSFGKVFASYNKTGNVNLAPYSLQNVYSQGNGFPFGGLAGYLPGTVYPNPNIKPEFVTSYEAGFQVGLFQDRLNLEAGYVYSDSRDQIFTATTSAATGYRSARVNAARLTNNIIEATISGDVVRKENLRWNLGFNFAHINNQVKELYGDLTSVNKFRQAYAIQGKPYPSLQLSDYRRDPQGRVIVDGTTGYPSSASQDTYRGTMVPPYQMGFNTLVDYKGLRLAAQFDWRMGAHLYSEIANRMITSGTSPLTVQYDRQPFVIPNSVIETAPGVFTPNTEVKTQSGGKAYWNGYVAPYQVNYAAKADFLKLRELNLSYSLPPVLLGRQKLVKGATVGVIAQNLFTIRAKDNDYGDPEYSYNNTEGYLSFRQVPPYRNVGFTLNVTL
ncbi:SusC/RagA family TonB-linked outer membrane protein [Hymenobacter aerilatus]|uniref:SusC/RagA family TonB-linked outer membrane protein n=1 Tax=Hymenobacter aerilatus TaxID=2932251 RepID=A0A8T9SPP0_9BACT|nr:SusC/RagA family TonB-linked outer membrane protein [Hymenobacter aerilatus]UOR03677.1 SusC/RagA family TonB-linked outer membrane protein [Hymenobacter aerilatus]